MHFIQIRKNHNFPYDNLFFYKRWLFYSFCFFFKRRLVLLQSTFRSSKNSLHTRNNFSRTKWLCHVVICTEL